MKDLPVGEKAKLKKRRVFGFGLQLAFRFRNSMQERWKKLLFSFLL
jgi:hypothetical protein